MREIFVGLAAAVFLLGCSQNHEPGGGSDMEEYKGTGRGAGQDTGGNGRSYDRGGTAVPNPGGHDESAPPAVGGTNSDGGTGIQIPVPYYRPGETLHI